jgi:hypothetical protein
MVYIPIPGETQTAKALAIALVIWIRIFYFLMRAENPGRDCYPTGRCLACSGLLRREIALFFLGNAHLGGRKIIDGVVEPLVEDKA